MNFSNDSRSSIPRTIREALARVRARLEAAGVEEADVLAEWIMAEVTHTGRAALRASLSSTIHREKWDWVESMVLRLSRGEPWAYVCGWTQFRNLQLKSDRRALIPRPETEELVDHVVRLARTHGARRICDVGTGSGCIALSLAWECPEAEIVATDISADALDLAAENARRLHLDHRIAWVEVNPDFPVPEGRWDLIVSNPPYVPTNLYETLPASIRNWEPRTALDGGPDGLAVIRTLILEAVSKLRPGGYLAMEIGEDQADAVQAMARAAGLYPVEVLRDSNGRNRFFIARSSFQDVATTAL